MTFTFNRLAADRIVPMYISSTCFLATGCTYGISNNPKLPYGFQWQHMREVGKGLPGYCVIAGNGTNEKFRALVDDYGNLVPPSHFSSPADPFNLRGNPWFLDYGADLPQEQARGRSFWPQAWLTRRWTTLTNTMSAFEYEFLLQPKPLSPACRESCQQCEDAGVSQHYRCRDYCRYVENDE